MDTPQVNDRKNEEHALDIFSILRDVLRSWLLILMAGIVAQRKKILGKRHNILVIQDPGF